jgi:hypothetical protein
MGSRVPEDELWLSSERWYNLFQEGKAIMTIQLSRYHHPEITARNVAGQKNWGE